MKTSVEWLIEQLENSNVISKYAFPEIIEKAKAMEKEQIINAYSIGAINGEMIERDIKPKYTNPIQYYNENFKSE